MRRDHPGWRMQVGNLACSVFARNAAHVAQILRQAPATSHHLFRGISKSGGGAGRKRNCLCRLLSSSTMTMGATSSRKSLRQSERV